MGYALAAAFVALALWRAIARPVEVRSRAMLLVTAGVFCGVLAVHVVAFDLTLTGSSVAMLLAAGALVGLGCGLLVRTTEGGQNGMVHGVGWILAIPTLTAAGIQVAVAADSLTSTTLMFAALYGTTALAAAALVAVAARPAPVVRPSITLDTASPATGSDTSEIHVSA